MKPPRLLVLALVLGTVVPAQLDAGIPGSTRATREQAMRFFGKYKQLDRAADPALADLYCDTARIQVLHYPAEGRSYVVDVPAATHIGLIREHMAAVKPYGRSSFGDPYFQMRDDGNVRISARRTSPITHLESQWSIVIGPCGDRAWAVLEETGEVRK